MHRSAGRMPIVVTAALLALLMSASGCGEDAPALDSPQSKAAIEQYRTYLGESATDLVTRVKTMTAQVKAGELPEAGSTYSAARVPYGQVKPAAESLFGSLASRIDAGTDDVPASEFSGFHRVEEDLWNEGSPSLAATAEQLLADVKELQHRLTTAKLQTVQIVNSANDVLDEASATARHGGEEPNFLNDMVDIGANVEGAEAAFEAAKPPLEEADSELPTEIEAAFTGAYKGLRNFGRVARRPDQQHPEVPGVTFVAYGQRTQTEYNELGEKLDAVSGALSEASAAVAP